MLATAFAEVSWWTIGHRDGRTKVRDRPYLPTDPAAAREALADVWQRAASERVEVACGGGRGRTGTALACRAVLDGVSAGNAVRYVRQHYDPRAVETPWQRRFVDRF